MEVDIRLIEDFEEALVRSRGLEGPAGELTRDLQDPPFPRGGVGRLLRRHFERPECAYLEAFASLEGHEAEGPQHLGSLLCVPFEDPLTGDVTPFITLLWVDPDWRHRGLARQLVEVVRGLMLKRGFERLAARAGHNDDALVSMGERWGFVRVWEWMVHE